MSADPADKSLLSEKEAVVDIAQLLKTLRNDRSRVLVMEQVAKYLRLNVSSTAQAIDRSLDVGTFEELAEAADANTRRFEADAASHAART